VTEFRSVDEPGARRRVSLGLPAQLAEHRPALVDVDSLAHQGGTVAVSATFSAGISLVDTAPKEGKLKIGNVVNGSAHRGGIRRR